jgi:hypothetical protein
LLGVVESLDRPVLDIDVLHARNDDSGVRVGGTGIEGPLDRALRVLEHVASLSSVE